MFHNCAYILHVGPYALTFKYDTLYYIMVNLELSCFVFINEVFMIVLLLMTHTPRTPYVIYRVFRNCI